MEKYLVTASTDGVDVDFEMVLKLDHEPGYYEVYDLCMEHDCPLFYVSEL